MAVEIQGGYEYARSRLPLQAGPPGLCPAGGNAARCTGPPRTPAKAIRTEPAPALVEAFQKGPISLSAKVTRTLASGEQSELPLFQVPVLKFKDKLELAFSGEAFDQRVTDADWSLIVVFLPRTIAPTDQGVVDFRLKRKDGRMVVPPIRAPYDSVPMIFLIPDKNGRKKVLKDLNDHLESFRTLCAKISDISTERAAADKFIQDLDAIDKNLSPAQYDNALAGLPARLWRPGLLGSPGLPGNLQIQPGQVPVPHPGVPEHQRPGAGPDLGRAGDGPGRVRRRGARRFPPTSRSFSIWPRSSTISGPATSSSTCRRWPGTSMIPAPTCTTATGSGPRAMSAAPSCAAPANGRTWRRPAFDSGIAPGRIAPQEADPAEGPAQGQGPEPLCPVRP